MFLFIMIQKINEYRRDLKETQYMSFLTKDNELQKSIMKFGTKSVILLKKEFAVIPYTPINILKLE